MPFVYNPNTEQEEWVNDDEVVGAPPSITPTTAYVSPGAIAWYNDITGVSEQQPPMPISKMKKSGYSRSSLSPQDLAYQIGESIESLDRELGEALSAKEELATRLEVVEESYRVILDRISSLRMVANQLRTSYGLTPPSGQSESAPMPVQAGLGIQQVGLAAGAVGWLTALAPSPPGQG